MDDSHVESRRIDRPVFAPAAGQRHRRRRPRRQFCRDQEDQAGQRIEGQSSQLIWATPKLAKASTLARAPSPATTMASTNTRPSSKMASSWAVTPRWSRRSECQGAYIGAASCITEDVPEDSLAIGRARQIVKEGWMKQKREPRPKPESRKTAPTLPPRCSTPPPHHRGFQTSGTATPSW